MKHEPAEKELILKSKKVNELFSIGTTFNKRLYESDYCEIVKSMQKMYPTMDFFIFHENEFEKEKYGHEVEIKENWDNLHVYDLFKLNPWLSNFLKTSPFKDSHTFGKQGEFDAINYWKRNGIYWFRKVVAQNNIKEMIKTPYLIWVGCDVKWAKPIDQLFFDWIGNFDICHIDRSPFGLFTETDIIIYHINDRTKTFIEQYLNFYLTGSIFLLSRWDDCVAFDGTKFYTKDIKFGNLLKKTGCPFDIYEYLFHHRNPLMKIRDIKPGI